MKRGLGLILIICIAFTLSSCKKAEYNSSFILLNDETVYVMEENVCRKHFSEKVAEKDGVEYHIGTCTPPYYTVLVDGEYVDVLDYIKDNDIDVDKLIDSPIVEIYHTEPIYETLGIDMSNLQLVSVTAHIKDGEISREMGTKLETFTFEVDFEDIKDDIISILSSEGGLHHNFCFAGDCETVYGPSPDFYIKLTDSSTTFVITIDDKEYIQINERNSQVDRDYFEVSGTSEFYDIARSLDHYFIELYKEKKE